MTFKPLARRPHADAAPVGDRSVAFILVLLLALVFAPALGLHVALAAFGPDPAASTERGSIAQPAGPSAKLARG